MATFSLAAVGLLGFLAVRSNRAVETRPGENPPATLPPAAKEIQATFQSFDLPQRSTGVEGVCYLNALEGDGPVQSSFRSAGNYVLSIEARAPEWPNGPVVWHIYNF